MKTKLIRKQDNDKFLKDIKTVRDVMVWAGVTETYLRTTKREILKEAESQHIYYEMTDTVFNNRRKVMVIL